MKDIVPNSPNSAQSGVYGSVPVGLFTGTMQENINIYELKTKNLSLPVTLSYNSNGLIVDKVASWVGFDWNLDAGGVITTTAKGARDQHVKLRDSLPGNIFTDNNLLRNFLSTAYPAYDYEPDVYSYNFPGSFGRFILDVAGSKAIMIPYRPYRITTTGTSFTITDENGISYVFAQKEDFYCASCPDQNIFPVSWYLTSVTHPAGDVINLYYTIDTTSYFAGLSHAVTKKLWEDCTGTSPCTDTETYPRAGGVTFYTPLLDSIVTSTGGKVIFVKSGGRTDFTDGRKLDRIIIKNNQNTIIKSIDFEYTFTTSHYNYPEGNPIDYYGIQGPDYTNELDYRMFLTGIRFSDSWDQKVFRYSFEYKNLSMLPSRLSFAQDYWGFFNGAPNTEFVPSGYTAYTQFSGIGGNRNPNAAYSQNGLLERIYYPTGGYSLIEYEQNSSGTNVIGGCRVKKVFSYTDASAAPVVKRYFYNNYNTLSSSFGYFRMPYNFFYESDTYSYCTQNTPKTCHWGTLVSNSLVGTIYNNISSITYPVVTISNGENFEAGGETHYFYLENDVEGETVSISGNEVFPVEYSNDGWYSGRKSRETYLKKDISGQLIPVRDIFYYHNFDESRNALTYTGLAISKRQSPNPPVIMWDPLNDFDLIKYFIYSRWEHPDSTSIIDFDDNGNIIARTTSYTYSNPLHNQVTVETSKNSDGRTEVKKYYYPQDYNSGIQNFPALINKNILNQPIDQRIYYNNRLTHLEQFKYNDNGLLTDYYNADISASDIPFVSSSPYTATHRATFTYDAKSNYVNIKEDNKNDISYIWAYQDAYPVVMIEGLAYNAISSSIKSIISGRSYTTNSDYSSVKTDVDLIKAQLSAYLNNPAYRIRIFTYKPQVGMTSETDPNGLTTYYEYDNFGRLKNVKDNDGNILKNYDYYYKTSN